ncbi:MAG: hypothetical protein AB8B69_08720 [Chitinophagales bacterium]
MSEINNPTNTQPQIDAIRNIIFGQNMQDYDQKFSTLNDSLKQNRSEIDEKIEQTKNYLLEEMRQMENRFNAQLQELNDRLTKESERLEDKKLNRKQLGELLIEIGNKISI